LLCRNVRWQYADIVPDYLLGRDAACLFLSLRCILKREGVQQAGQPAGRAAWV
jgi:hypothetical protein